MDNKLKFKKVVGDQAHYRQPIDKSSQKRVDLVRDTLLDTHGTYFPSVFCGVLVLSAVLTSYGLGSRFENLQQNVRYYLQTKKTNEIEPYSELELLFVFLCSHLCFL